MSRACEIAERASLLILIFIPQQPRHPKTRLGCRLNAGDAQWAERHGCRESAARTWMSVQRGPTERRRSEGTRRSRAQPGARTLGYLVSFQVTRRRRNSLDVRTNQTLSVTQNCWTCTSYKRACSRSGGKPGRSEIALNPDYAKTPHTPETTSCLSGNPAPSILRPESGRS